jgi:predicted RNA-binding Zn ribbon-like protein
VRSVRDAAWIIVHAAIDGTRPPAAAISVVNGAASTAPTVLTLAWDKSGPVRDARPTGTHDAPLAWRLAVAIIELVTGPDAFRVRRCARPGCSMLFVQHHGHRRFCHPSCSHTMRQDRYRHRQPGAQ